MPYRERLTVLINELGAGVSGRSGDLQAALDRAVPALTETDNLLRLLANDSHTLQDLTASSNAVITALANNSKQVARFVTEANNTAVDTATQQTALRQTFHNLPGFLEQLRPALAKLDSATAANEPVLANLNAASTQINRLFTDLPPFAHSALPAIKSLGRASVTGRQAVIAARPTIAHLNTFATSTPELAQNLRIVLDDLDTQNRAVERDPRSPGGQGFSGLQALLGYAFNQTLAINYFGPFGHMLAVDAFVDLRCTPYATPGTIATNLKLFGASNYRQCYSWLGPNQPGVNEPDPTCTQANGCKSPCVPDPGGAPPGESGPPTTACKLAAGDTGTREGRLGANPGQHAFGQRRRRWRWARRVDIDRWGRRRRRHIRRWLVGQRHDEPWQDPPGNPRAAQRQVVRRFAAVEPVAESDPATPQLPALVVRRRQQSAFTNPVLIGAVTTLAVLVAVFLAYNSNAGLPFVPTRQLKVEVSNGSDLVVNNDVREGGFLIGRISEIKPVMLRQTGAVGAQLTLQLNQSAGPVPMDSRATVLSKSVLGLKYLDLVKGTSKHVYQDGATMSIGHTTVPVQIDQVFNMFDAPTRTAIQRDLVGFGDTFASRGSAFNDTVASLPELLLHLRPVAQYLSSPPAQLTRFFTSLDRFMRVVAPVASVNAQLFTDMATTFAAISNSPRALESTIAKSPSTLSVSTTSLRVQQPFLTDFATLGRGLVPASAALRASLPDINPAIEVGTRVLGRTPPLNSRLQGVMGALKHLARAPGTNVALNGLTSTVGILNPMVKYLGPYQTVCDYWNYWWTYLSEHLSEATSFGFAQRALLNQTNPLQPNNVGTQGAPAPVNGGALDTPFGGNEFLHAQPYGAAIDNQGNADCEVGQRGYPLQAQLV